MHSKYITKLLILIKQHKFKNLITNKKLTRGEGCSFFPNNPLLSCTGGQYRYRS